MFLKIYFIILLTIYAFASNMFMLLIPALGQYDPGSELIGLPDQSAGASNPIVSSSSPSPEGSKTINNYNFLTQKEDNVYFMAYPLYKDVFHTSDPITIQFLIINALDEAIILDRIDCNVPKNFTNSTLYSGSLSLNKSSIEYFDYNITAKAPNDYLIGPAILNYSKEGTIRRLSAGLINVHVINRNPEIKNITIQQIEPYPNLISNDNYY